jgi:hypothetical protein
VNWDQHGLDKFGLDGLFSPEAGKYTGKFFSIEGKLQVIMPRERFGEGGFEVIMIQLVIWLVVTQNFIL